MSESGEIIKVESKPKRLIEGSPSRCSMQFREHNEAARRTAEPSKAINALTRMKLVMRVVGSASVLSARCGSAGDETSRAFLHASSPVNCVSTCLLFTFDFSDSGRLKWSVQLQRSSIATQSGLRVDNPRLLRFDFISLTSKAFRHSVRDETR